MVSIFGKIAGLLPKDTDSFTNTVWIYVILGIVGIDVLIASYSLSRGMVDVFPFLFFIPIILTAYFYPRYGILASFLIGAVYLVLFLFYAQGDPLILSRALLISLLFIGIGSIISMLSGNIDGLKRKYRKIFETSDAGIMLIERRGDVIHEVNPSIARQLGYSGSDAGEIRFSDLWRDKARCAEFSAAIAENGRISNFEAELLTETGSIQQFLISGCLFGDDRILCTLINITQQVRAQADLVRSEMKYRQFVETAQEGVWVFDTRGITTFVNPRMAEMLGYSPAELQGKPISAFLDDESITRLHDGGKHREVKFIRNGGARLCASLSISPLTEEQGGVSGTLVLVSDITQRILHEERLKHSLQEKEVLLREVHHRVKNNMQVICSLLELNAVRTEDEGLREQFRGCEGRVRSMALVHEKLYHSDDMGSINAAGYFRTLIADVLTSFSLATEITLDVQVQETVLDLDRAIPCGLIVNELLTNALKYAFSDREKGTISLAFGLDPDAKNYRLVFSDDGAGLPADIEVRTASTLGLRLVNVLVGQLRGALRIERAKGTLYEIIFPAVDA